MNKTWKVLALKKARRTFSGYRQGRKGGEWNPFRVDDVGLLEDMGYTKVRVLWSSDDGPPTEASDGAAQALLRKRRRRWERKHARRH